LPLIVNFEAGLNFLGHTDIGLVWAGEATEEIDKVHGDKIPYINTKYKTCFWMASL
jgi:hypothetical protein